MLSQRKTKKVIIIGGGYAGLSTLISLRQQDTDFEIMMFDPNPYHLRKTHLHECFRHSADYFRVPFANIASRFRFTHIQAAVAFELETLKDWSSAGKINLGDTSYDFDYLVIATGSTNVQPVGIENVFSLDDLIVLNPKEILEKLSNGNKSSKPTITIVGAGATGIQFLFELNELLKQWRLTKGFPCNLRLVNSETGVLNQFPRNVNRYVSQRISREGIEHINNALLIGQEGSEIILQNATNHKQFSLPSSLTLSFLGQKTSPATIYANRYGQVIVNGEVLENIFTAGDCSMYQGSGANTMSAQIAVRKGKKIARNIKLHSRNFRFLERYSYQELGYFISLGPMDGVGWLGVKANVLTALPAFAIKEAVEVQFDLLLAGVDTFLI